MTGVGGVIFESASVVFRYRDRRQGKDLTFGSGEIQMVLFGF